MSSKSRIIQASAPEQPSGGPSAPVAAFQPKKKPRGKPFQKGNTFGFKKGQSGRPGGSARVHVKFATRILEELAAPAPLLFCKVMGLHKDATMYDCMIRALCLQAANGDSNAFVTVRETAEGRLPVTTRNFNLTAAAEKFLDDPGFRQFLAEAHGEYMQSQGITEEGVEVHGNGTGKFSIPAGSPLSRILKGERAKD